MVKTRFNLDPLLTQIKDEVKNSQWTQILAIISSSLCLLNVGITFAWTSPTIPQLLSNGTSNGITLEEASYFNVIPSAITIPIAPLVVYVFEKVGRKMLQVLAAVPLVISWILIICDHSLMMIYISRVAVGISLPFCMACTIYIGEIAEPKMRGSWGNCPTIFIGLGQLIVNTVGSYYDIRTTALICSSFSILQFAMMALMPESPHFLLMRNKPEEAMRSLQLLRWRKNVEEEFAKIEDHVRLEASRSAKLSEVFTDATNRKCVCIAIGLLATPHLSGYGAFFTYTQYIFELAGGTLSQSTSAILINIVFVASMSASIFYVDRFNRHALLIVSCLGCGAILSVLTAYFHLLEKTAVDITSISWIPLVGMMAYIAVYSIGLGTIPLLMLGELFATNVRGKALSVVNIFFQMFALGVPKMFQIILTATNGLTIPFLLFTICCCLGAVFSYFCVPHTRGKTLGEIQASM